MGNGVDGLLTYQDAQHINDCSESDLLLCASQVHNSTRPITSSVTFSNPLSLCLRVGNR